MSKNKAKFEVSISKSVTVQLWGDLPIYSIFLKSETLNVFLDYLPLRSWCRYYQYVYQDYLPQRCQIISATHGRFFFRFRFKIFPQISFPKRYNVNLFEIHTCRYIQGVFFDWSAQKMTKCQTLRKFWHLELFWRDLHVIWHLVIF